MVQSSESAWSCLKPEVVDVLKRGLDYRERTQVGGKKAIREYTALFTMRPSEPVAPLSLGSLIASSPRGVDASLDPSSGEPAAEVGARLKPPPAGEVAAALAWPEHARVLR